MTSTCTHYQRTKTDTKDGKKRICNCDGSWHFYTYDDGLETACRCPESLSRDFMKKEIKEMNHIQKKQTFGSFNTGIYSNQYELDRHDIPICKDFLESKETDTLIIMGKAQGKSHLANAIRNEKNEKGITNFGSTYHIAYKTHEDLNTLYKESESYGGGFY